MTRKLSKWRIELGSTGAGKILKDGIEQEGIASVTVRGRVNHVPTVTVEYMADSVKIRTRAQESDD